MTHFAIKRELAARAATLVSSGETVFIENGSCNALLARTLAERGDINVDAAVAGKGHLGQGDQQTAVGTVVPGQQLIFSHQRLHCVPEAFQLRDIANVGSHIAKLTINLRQRGRPQRIVPLA